MKHVSKMPASDPVRRIVSAARAHYFASGFRSVTMDDLATELGMSKKTLYAHFPSKLTLLEAVLEEKFAGVKADMQTVIERHVGDFSGTLHGMLDVMSRQIAEVKPPFLRDMRREGPEVFALVEKRRSAVFAQSFEYLISEGRKTGMVRKDIPVKLVVEMVLSAVRSIVTPEKIVEMKISPHAAISAIVAVILNGVVIHPHEA